MTCVTVTQHAHIYTGNSVHTGPGNNAQMERQRRLKFDALIPLAFFIFLAWLLSD